MWQYGHVFNLGGHEPTLGVNPVCWSAIAFCRGTRVLSHHIVYDIKTVKNGAVREFEIYYN